MVDHGPMRIEALAPEDTRVHIARVAGPAALLVSKVFKIAERQEQRVMVYDATPAAAFGAVKALALRVLADRVDAGEEALYRD